MFRSPFAPAVILLICAAAAPAQVDFVAVDIGATLDQLYAIDITNPAAVATPAPIATLAGNFIRGVELTAQKTGWYVATSASGGSPTGFYRLDDGVSTLVAPLPFTSTAVGGMAFSQAEDFLYWSVDPPTGDDALYRIDFNGTFTLIAPITIPGVAAVVIAGLAMDHQTNTLYAIDTGIDSLLVIDQTTGVATVVGTGLGVAISAVGGLDFSQDGTNHLYMACPSTVYQVDPVTGLAGPSLGTLPHGSSSSLCGIPGRTTLKLSPLQLGTVATIGLSGGEPGAFFELFVSTGGAYIPLPPIGIVRIDIASPLFFSLVSGNLDAAGSFTLPIALPPDPSLVGIPVFLQAYVVQTTPQPVRLTNPAFAAFF
jgi:hypothetical protein